MSDKELEQALKQMYALSAVSGTLQACLGVVINTGDTLNEVAQVLPMCDDLIQQDVTTLSEMATVLDGLVDKYAYVAVTLSNKVASNAKAPA